MSETTKKSVEENNEYERVKDSLQYQPTHFIRAHSKYNDPSDCSTAIWGVMFEPDLENKNKTTNLVATCGGNIICVFDVISGCVRMKYKHKDVGECFYTLAWSTLTKEGVKTNILASGGVRGEIRMYHPRNKVCYYSWRPVNKRNISVNSLAFHSSEPSWIFCATNDGVVTMWDVGIPNLPYFNGCGHKLLIKINPNYGDIYNIVWSGHDSNWLLAGSSAGLLGWNVETDKVKKQRSYQPLTVGFLLPVSDTDKRDKPVVDSVAVVGEWSVVTKCADHDGLIYLWDLKTSAANIDKNVEKDTIVEKEVELLAKHKWSDTDDFYLNMGCDKDTSLVVCGDDQGTLWLYDMSTMVQTCPQPVQDVVEPNTQILWPEVQDDYSRNPGSNEILVNKVALNWNGEFIVAVTSTNLVCIWRRVEKVGDI